MERTVEEVISQVKIGLRLIIVILTWFVVVTVPDSPKSFFQSLFIVTLTSAYEYVVMYLEAQDKLSQRLAVLGAIPIGCYFFLALFGLFDLVYLDIASMEFHFQKRFPIPNPTSISWSYYYTILPVIIFPALLVIQLINKPAKEATSAVRHHQKIENT